MQTTAAYVLANGEYKLASAYSEPGALPVATLPGRALEWAEIFDEVEVIVVRSGAAYCNGPPGGASLPVFNFLLA